MILWKKGVGRLFTIRFLSPVLDEEWDHFEREILEVVRTAPSQLIFCTDLRGATVFTDKVAERFIAAMRANSPKVNRAAVILPSDSPVLSLQFERIVREVGYASRRTFRSEREARVWLGEVLLPAEQESLLAFIAAWVPGSRPPPPQAPGSRPSDPGSRPSDPSNRPSDPSNRPSDPGSRPSDPGSRPLARGSRSPALSSRPPAPGSRPPPSPSPAGKPGSGVKPGGGGRG
jgi:hypothetical protein